MAATATPFPGPLGPPVKMTMTMIIAFYLLEELRKACSLTIHHSEKNTEGVRPIIPRCKHRSVQNKDSPPAAFKLHLNSGQTPGQCRAMTYLM